MIFNISSTYGFIQIGSLAVAWGCQVPGDGIELPGYFCIGNQNSSLEFGLVDQDSPGIYFTQYEKGDVARSITLLQFN